MRFKVKHIVVWFQFKPIVRLNIGLKQTTPTFFNPTLNKTPIKHNVGFSRNLTESARRTSKTTNTDRARSQTG